MHATAPSASSLNIDEILKCEVTTMVMQVSRGYNVLSCLESCAHADERVFDSCVGLRRFAWSSCRPATDAACSLGRSTRQPAIAVALRSRDGTYSLTGNERRRQMLKRYILTGAPGGGKTTLARALRQRGYCVVEEAAT